MTLVEMLEIHARDIPDKIAIIYYNTKISYRELNQTVNKLADALVEMGVNKGDKVGLMLPRVPELVISFLAIAKVQGVVVPINFELLDDKINVLLQNIDPRCLIVHEQFLNLAKRSIPSSLEIPVVVAGNNKNEEEISWDKIIKDKKSENFSFRAEDNDIVYLNYTSGSTGNPKGAITTHAQIYWNTIAAVDALKLTANDIHLCIFAPFAHPHELIARPLYLGGTMVLLDRIYPKSLAKVISDHSVTCMMGLAPMYEKLLDVLDHYEYDLSSLRVPESGGMHTRPELVERFRQKIGVPIIPVWGSTETTGIAITQVPGGPIVPGSVGKPCMSYEVKIVDENDELVGAGEIGELIFKGSAVVNGYYKYPMNSKNCFKNGWYYSGDLGKRDREGNIYFVDRKAGLMKVAGLKVYPLEIELALMEHPDIKETVVIASNDDLRGEVPKAIIVTKNGREITEKEIFAFCRGRIAQYKVPRIVEIRKFLPKIGSGKIDKKALEMEGA
ncbi:MAG: AMP-binding protein [Deltaproteobacteria bacterium]|nr:AMP-binding protein [Deltaproteobacteria bacterium]